jgi:5-methylthioadenosine/S-adenosylhomocysteine deaminase
MAAPVSIDLLVRAAFVYPVDAAMSVIPDGEIAIKDGAILYCGPRQPEGHWLPGRILGGNGLAALPGFVNCHSHTASVIFRSQTDDHVAKTALLDVAFRLEKDITEEEWGLCAMLGTAEMIRAGITTINDIWYAPERLATLVEQSGLRAQLAYKVFDVKLENLRDGDYTHYPNIGERRLADGIAFAERWNGRAEGRITTRIGTHATDTCSQALLQTARAEATRLGFGLHIHCAQSSAEVDEIRSRHGCGPVTYLDRIGYLGEDTVLAHLVFASDDEFALIANANAPYAHASTIYPRRGRYPDLAKILKHGIRTGLATDWMLNDPFEAMRYALNGARMVAGSPQALSCDDALYLQTMGAASVLGLDTHIGSLEQGKRADLILVDIDQPHLQPYYGSSAALVYYARASDVTTSIVDGKIIMDHGNIPGLPADLGVDAIRAATPRWRSQLQNYGSRAVAGPGCLCG